MRRRAVVLRGVLVLRVVATSDVAAFEAKPKMDPGVSRGEALFASVRCVRAVVARATEVNAKSLRHLLSLRYAVGC